MKIVVVGLGSVRAEIKMRLYKSLASYVVDNFEISEVKIKSIRAHKGL